MLLNERRFYDFGPFTVDERQRLLLREGQAVRIATKTFDVLLVLLSKAGDLTTREELGRRVWGDISVTANNVDQHVAKLRDTLGQSPNGQTYIETVRGVGFRFLGAVIERRENPSKRSASQHATGAVPEEQSNRAGEAIDVTTTCAVRGTEVEIPAIGHSMTIPGNATELPVSPLVTAPSRSRSLPQISRWGVLCVVGLAVAVLGWWIGRSRSGQKGLHSWSRSVRVLSAATSQGSGPIRRTLGQISNRLVGSADGKTLYAFEYRGKNVVVLDVATLAIRKTLTLSSSIQRPVLGPDLRHIYCPSMVDGVISIDTTSGRVQDLGIRTEGPVQDLALSPATNKMFLALGFRGVKVADMTTQKLRTFSEHGSAEFLKLDPSGKQLFVSYQGSGPGGWRGHDALVVYDSSSGAVLSTPLKGLPRVGGDLLFRSGGGLVLADGWDACSTGSYDHIGCPSVPSHIVHALWTGERAFVEAIPTPVDSTFSTLTPDGTRLLLGGRSLTVVDIVRRTISERLQVPELVNTPMFTSDGRHLVVAVATKPELWVFNPEACNCMRNEIGVGNAYSGDGSADDAIGAGHGILEGGVDFSPGFVGQAFQFSATLPGRVKFAPEDSCLECGDEWSISLLVKWSLRRASTLVERVPSTRPGFKLSLDSNGSAILTSVDPKGRIVSTAGTTKVELGKWFQFHVVDDGAFLRLFTNGKEDARLASYHLGRTDPETKSRLGPAYIGSDQGWQRSFVGLIDELVFYSRALSAREIHDAYESAVKGSCRKPL